ncbi:Non-specific serine/threonine protein kinase [Bertholletia excelsa]
MVDRRNLVFALGILFSLFHYTFQQAEPLSLHTEWVALIKLRSSLGLRSEEWPLKADPCSLWIGIQCRNGRITGINISGFKRTRMGSKNPQFAVDSLVDFRVLRSFNASGFLLPGSIPVWFGQRLASLQVLDLRSCSIIGAIPSSLGNLTNLTALYLSDNKLSGIVPPTLGQLFSLSVLDLSQNSLTGPIPLSFGSLGNLTSLDMSSNFLSGIIPPSIGNLFKLQFLNLSSNNLSSSIPAQLGDLSSLVDLDLSLNSLSGMVPVDLRGLRSLKKIVIRDNLLAGPLPGNLFPAQTQLQIIILNHNNFSGDLPDVLWSMPHLQFLDASQNNFAGALPEINLNTNVNAAVVNISQNMFYGHLTSVLTRFNVVNLSGNFFQGGVPSYGTSNASLDRNCLQNVLHQRSDVECASFYAERGLTFDNVGLPNATQPPSIKPVRKNHIKWIILGGLMGGVGFVLLLVTLTLLLIACTHKRQASNQRGISAGPTPASGSPLPPVGLSLKLLSLGEALTCQQILQATDDFSDVNLIKHGHSGNLYKGILGGIPIVVKKIDLLSVKEDDYVLELDFLSKVSHARIIPLLGHGLENENEKILVYKYMPNMDLSSSLYKKTKLQDDNLQSLDWITRLKIAIGVAEGLSYLHHECSPPLVHRDVQASSILLDDKFEVRLGSLSKVCAQEGDIHQSTIMRLLRLPQTSQLASSGSPTATCTYDVYCFGKVLLELVTGKLGISASSEGNVKDWLESTLPYISIYDKELVTNIVDPSLIIDEDLLEEVWATAIVARSCLNPKPSRRPLMRYVLKALENPLKVVREEHSSSGRLRTTSSRGSWNAALFGSWRSSAEVVRKADGGNSFKHPGASACLESSQNGGIDLSPSNRRRFSKEIFAEPSEVLGIERSSKDRVDIGRS